MTQEVVNILRKLSSWLYFQRQLGVETLPKGHGLDTFLKLSKHGMHLKGPSPRTAMKKKGNSSTLNSLAEVLDLLGDCKRCELYRERHNIILGEGPENAKLLLLGEAPGREEDLQGRPFVGASGELLNKMLAAINISRKDIYITNIVKCRPPHNRTPRPEEIAKCRPFLENQLRIIDPPLILALGRVAAQCLLKSHSSLGSLRGHFHQLGMTKVIVTYHPSYLLRNKGDRQKELKREAWHDLQLLEREYSQYR
ncbi:MAG: uracil-DNA glycosylase [Nitrospiraceae bacterium]|nr:uracil-DNA glycosylase [Nitrospiraceae bacterium]